MKRPWVALPFLILARAPVVRHSLEDYHGEEAELLASVENILHFVDGESPPFDHTTWRSVPGNVFLVFPRGFWSSECAVGFNESFGRYRWARGKCRDYFGRGLRGRPRKKGLGKTCGVAWQGGFGGKCFGLRPALGGEKLR